MSQIVVQEVVTARPGAHISDDEAVLVRRELLRGQGSRPEFTAADVVDIARDEESPLHRFFEWDDRVGAERYRQHQARVLISSIVVRIDEVQVPAFVNVPRRVLVEEQDPPLSAMSPYVPTEQAMGDDAMAEHVLRQARREMKSFREKYERYVKLNEKFRPLQQVFAAMEAAEGNS